MPNGCGEDRRISQLCTCLFQPDKREKYHVEVIVPGHGAMLAKHVAFFDCPPYLLRIGSWTILVHRDQALLGGLSYKSSWVG